MDKTSTLNASSAILQGKSVGRIVRAHALLSRYTLTSYTQQDSFLGSKMSYIEKNLMADEEMVHVTRLHPIVLLMPAAATSLLAGSLPIVDSIPYAQVVVGILLFVALWKLSDRLVLFLSSEFGVTSKRVLGKTGFIRRTSLDIVLSKVEAIRLSQSILGRILNYGDIEVTGTGGTDETLRFLPDPLVFRKVVQEQLALLEEGERHGADTASR